MGGREGVGKEDGRHSHSHTHSHSTLTLTLTKRTSWHRFSLFCGCWVSNTFCCVVNWRERGASFLAQLGRHLSLQASKPKKKKGAFSTPQANPNKKPTRAHKQQHSTVCPQKRSKPNSLLLTACLLSFPQKKREHFHLSCPIVPQRTHSPFLLAVLDTFPSVSVCVCACACLWCCCWFSVLPAFFLSCVLFRCTFSPTPLLPPTTPNKPTSTTTH